MENEKDLQEDMEQAASEEDVTEEASEVEILKRQQEEMYDQYLRLKADFENYKRRSEKERLDIISRSLEDLLTQLLPVLDNFERALKSEGDDAYKEGVYLVYEQLMQVLGNEGLVMIDALGAQFDPEYHHAVVTECVEDKDDNTVLEVLQTGYLYKDRLLRPAMVIVNKHS